MIYHPTPQGVQQVTVQDVQDRYDGTLPVTVQATLEDAEAIIMATVPQTARRLATGRLAWQVFLHVVCDMVLRVVRNPDGFNSEGDGSYNFSRNAAVASGNLWLTANDMELLTGDTGQVPGVIRMRGW